eukprot:1113648-Amphidinium_carterae.1
MSTILYYCAKWTDGSSPNERCVLVTQPPLHFGVPTQAGYLHLARLKSIVEMELHTEGEDNQEIVDKNDFIKLFSQKDLARDLQGSRGQPTHALLQYTDPLSAFDSMFVPSANSCDANKATRKCAFPRTILGF